jgi:hypothetical protein
MWAIAFGVGVLVVLVLTARGTSLSNARLGFVLAANFALYIAGQILTGQSAPWLWFLAVDCLCAFIVLHPPASRLAAVIGSIYVLQIIIHVAFAGAGSAATAGLYLNLLAIGGWCQLLVLATGAIQHGRGRKVGIAGNSGGAVAVAPVTHP